jgi:hypothetical protein
MGMLQLSASNLAAFVAEQRAQSGPWLLHHIPKTAGSSLAAEISAGVGAFENLVPDYSGGLAYHESLDRLTRRVIERSGTAGAPRAFSGHLNASQVANLRRKVDGLRCVTFLRHPVARVISEYNYCLTTKHPPHREFAARYPTIEAYVADTSEMNKAATMMFGTARIDPSEAVAEMGRTYVMVGLRERYPVSFLLMSAMMWAPALPKVHERVGEPAAPPSPEVVRAILAANAVDLALFEAVSDVYDRLAPAIWATFNPQRPA